MAGTWAMTNKSYLWSSLTYGFVSSPYSNSSAGDFLVLASQGDDQTGVCVEKSHILDLLAALPINGTSSTNIAYMNWNNVDSICQIRAVVYIDEQ